jgi:hypothetical protein
LRWKRGGMGDKRKKSQRNRSSHDRTVTALPGVDFDFLYAVICCGVHGDNSSLRSMNSVMA